MSRKNLSLAVVSLIVAATPALGFVIDGHLLDDWGVSVADNNASTFSFLPTINIVGQHIEDQSDYAGDGGYLGPNYGGQNYDAEMMAVALEGNQLLISIVSGQRPDNGFNRFGPGDLRIETSVGTYGIEIGGGAGGTTGAAITEGASGSTYALNGSGFTTGHTASLSQLAGSIWAAPTWLNDPINPQEPTQIQPGTGTYLGTADYAYTLNDDLTNEHAVIEMSIDASLFAGQTLGSVHWRPSCGNDELNADINVPIPEPSALFMCLGGSLALVATKRR